jgi:phage baseplate assembly protein W
MAAARHIDFLGGGWDFPVGPGADQPVAYAADEEKITQAIWLILATAPGERAMRPTFGCGIHRLVFSINDSTTLNNVADEVRTALIQWEPRVDVLEVKAEPRGAGELLLINVRYRVRTTNNLFNLVYPFYLGGAVTE